MPRLKAIVAYALGGAAVVTGVAVLAANFNSRDLEPLDLPVLQTSPLDEGGLSNAIQTHDPLWGPVAMYPVIEDGTLYPIPGGTLGDIWATFTRLVTPAYASEYMASLAVVSAPDSPVLAAVAVASVEPLRWTLVINAGQPILRRPFPQILIHEYGHLLALHDDQLDRMSADCATHQLPEGCLRADSDLLAFYDEFWADLAHVPAAAWGAIAEDEDQFVSERAAHDVVEDFAESFTAFVRRDRPRPSAGTWAQKVLFFWSEPKYLAIREHIWAWFGDKAPQPTRERPDVE